MDNLRTAFLGVLPVWDFLIGKRLLAVSHTRSNHRVERVVGIVPNVDVQLYVGNTGSLRTGQGLVAAPASPATARTPSARPPVKKPATAPTVPITSTIFVVVMAPEATIRSTPFNTTRFCRKIGVVHTAGSQGAIPAVGENWGCGHQDVSINHEPPRNLAGRACPVGAIVNQISPRS